MTATDKAVEIKKLDDLLLAMGITEEILHSSPELQESVANLLGAIYSGETLPSVAQQNKILTDFERKERNRAKRRRKANR